MKFKDLKPKNLYEELVFFITLMVITLSLTPVTISKAATKEIVKIGDNVYKTEEENINLKEDKFFASLGEERIESIDYIDTYNYKPLEEYKTEIEYYIQKPTKVEHIVKHNGKIEITIKNNETSYLLTTVIDKNNEGYDGVKELEEGDKVDTFVKFKKENNLIKVDYLLIQKYQPWF